MAPLNEKSKYYWRELNTWESHMYCCLRNVINVMVLHFSLSKCEWCHEFANPNFWIIAYFKNIIAVNECFYRTMKVYRPQTSSSSSSSSVERPPSSDWLFCHFGCAHVKTTKFECGIFTVRLKTALAAYWRRQVLCRFTFIGLIRKFFYVIRMI